MVTVTATLLIFVMCFGFICLILSLYKLVWYPLFPLFVFSVALILSAAIMLYKNGAW